MEKFLKMSAAVLYSAVMCVCFTSCSDDNDEPGGGNDAPGVVNPANVFTGKCLNLLPVRQSTVIQRGSLPKYGLLMER